MSCSNIECHTKEISLLYSDTVYAICRLIRGRECSKMHYVILIIFRLLHCTVLSLQRGRCQYKSCILFPVARLSPNWFRNHIRICYICIKPVVYIPHSLLTFRNIDKEIYRLTSRVYLSNINIVPLGFSQIFYELPYVSHNSKWEIPIRM